MAWNPQREYFPENIATSINDEFMEAVFRIRPEAKSVDLTAHINSFVRLEKDEDGIPFEPKNFAQ